MLTNKIKQFNINCRIKGYLDNLCKTNDDTLRAYDHCRRAFRRAAYIRNPQFVYLRTPKGCKCEICGEDCQGANCRLCDNYLALNLMAYLSSWGMYRSSFLKKYDYTIHIGAVKILMDPKYLPLFDPWLCVNNFSDYKALVSAIYTDLLDYYRVKCTAIGKKTNGNNGVTDTLITKILLGVYGCMPAYDTYFKKGIARLGGIKNIKIGTKSSNLADVLDELCEIAKVLDAQIKATLASALSSWDKCGIYTPMKIIDMMLWGYGKNDS